LNLHDYKAIDKLPQVHCFVSVVSMPASWHVGHSTSVSLRCISI